MISTKLIFLTICVASLQVESKNLAKRNEEAGISCIFFKSKNAIECNNGVECEAIPNLSIGQNISFESYGIGVLNTEENSKENLNASSIKFHLYPKNLNGENYLNYTIPFGEEGQTAPISISSSQEENDFGFKIKDADCFEKIVDLFEEEKEKNGELTLNVTQEGIVPESMCQVSVYGSIKINNE
jgi:hypothetical protein